MLYIKKIKALILDAFMQTCFFQDKWYNQVLDFSGTFSICQSLYQLFWYFRVNWIWHICCLLGGHWCQGQSTNLKHSGSLLLNVSGQAQLIRHMKYISISIYCGFRILNKEAKNENSWSSIQLAFSVQNHSSAPKKLEHFGLVLKL